MTDNRRLIEVAFPLKQASIDSVHEKNVRHGHISTLHIWPARWPWWRHGAEGERGSPGMQPPRTVLASMVYDCATEHPRLRRVRDPFGNMVVRLESLATVRPEKIPAPSVR